MVRPPRTRRSAAALATVVAVLAATPLAVADAGRPSAAAPPQDAHRLTRDELDEFAGRLGPAGRLALDAIERRARREAAQAERQGLITPAQRAAVERCLRAGPCGGVDTERGLDALVDRLVAGLVETTVEPVLEAVLGR